ncbi:DsbA family protein [Candidatus Woesearchaeota archaeon]|nr:DsbA family protein [Candidatus Woesearchaeota archaeon]
MKKSGENEEKEVSVEKKDNDKKKEKNSERTENIVAIVVFAFLIIIGIGIFTKGFGLLDNSDNSGDRFRVPLGNDPFMGSTNASVVIIAFSNYECPFCKKGELIIQSLMNKYPDKIIYVFKEYPLISAHPNSYSAALAAECAKEQNKYWEYHHYLFEHNDQLEVRYLKEYATLTGLDSARFDDCLDNQLYKSEVNLDMNHASLIGVTGTPTFFIRNVRAPDAVRIIGAQPEAEFVKIIDSELDYRP